MDFSPTTPNPGADNRLGAIIFAGTGQGREGTRSLADSWFLGGARTSAWHSRSILKPSSVPLTHDLLQ